MPRGTGAIQNVTGACRTPARGAYNHRHNQAANNFHQELANKHEPSKCPPTPYYKHEPQSVLQHINYDLYCDTAKITDQTTHNNRPDTVTFHRTIKKNIINRCSNS